MTERIYKETMFAVKGPSGFVSNAWDMEFTEDIQKAQLFGKAGAQNVIEFRCFEDHVLKSQLKVVKVRIYDVYE